jgi:hypothetical protein
MDFPNIGARYELTRCMYYGFTKTRMAGEVFRVSGVSYNSPSDFGNLYSAISIPMLRVNLDFNDHFDYENIRLEERS